MGNEEEMKRKLRGNEGKMKMKWREKRINEGEINGEIKENWRGNEGKIQGKWKKKGREKQKRTKNRIGGKSWGRT